MPEPRIQDAVEHLDADARFDVGADHRAQFAREGVVDGRRILPRKRYVGDAAQRRRNLGQNGAALLRRVIVESPKYLRVGGTLLLELGGDQVEIVRPELVDVGYREMRVLRDDDGDVRGIAAVLGASPST